MDGLLWVCRIFLWLMTYSFLGWVYESTLCSITERRPVNRGFLNGPLCPIYGVGALLDILVFGGRTIGPLELFLASAVLTTTLEYLTSWAMEKLFHARWWDYSHYRFHINGRVCLLGFLAFGAFSVVLLNWLHPFIDSLIGKLPNAWMIGIALVLFGLLLWDLVVTVRHTLKLNHKLEEIQKAFETFVRDHRSKQEKSKGFQLLNLREQFEKSNFYTERIQKLLNGKKRQDKRLLRAFPRLHSTRYEDALETLRKKLQSKKDSKKNEKRH